MSFLKITEAKSANKGSFIGTVIKQGDLKSGTTKDGKDWTKKVFTLEDDSDSIEITTWDEEIKLFKVGNKYEITNPWWKMYEGKLNLNVGQHCQVKLIGTCASQSTIEASAPTTAPTSDEYLKQKQKEIQEQEIKNKSNLEEKIQSLFTNDELELMDKESNRLLVLESFWIKKLTIGGIAPNPNRVGMFVKLLDDKLGAKK